MAGNDLAAYEKVLALKPGLAEAWLGCGNVFVDLKRYDKAFPAFDRALALKPDLISVEGSRLFAKMNICDWSNLEAEAAHLIASVRNGHVSTSPFPFLIIPSSSEDRLQCAKHWVARKFPVASEPIWRGEKYNHDRIRVAYLSADFHQHATSYLIAGMFECHDKARFEITAISYGPADPTEMRARLQASNEHFIDAGADSDDRIDKLIRESEIDILVDLKGFTTNSRTSILARRPAPIQVNYLGFPGTMGANYIDYIVADRIVIPENQRDCYAEKIVCLPNSYQVNDAKRTIAERAFTRSELGLPPAGFVFCCFNNNYKITPRMFDCWMRLLKRVDGSVLWLLEDNASAASNLKKEAAGQRRECRAINFREAHAAIRALGKASGRRSFFGYASLQCAYDGKRCVVGGLAGADLSWRNVCGQSCW